MQCKSWLRSLGLTSLLTLLFLAPAVGGVVINEIYYHAPEDFDDLQWIELHNPDSHPVDISGWRFTRGIEFRFPDKSVLPAGGYVVVCKNARLFAEFYDAAVAGEFTKSLGRGGDTLILVDAAGSEIDRVKYDDRAPWPAEADGVSASLERITPNVSAAGVDNWSSSPLPEDMVRPTGSPGAVNAGYSANFPPVIHSVTIAPSNPAPGQRARVEAVVEDTDGVATVELRYRVVGPGTVGEENVVAMSATGGHHFSAELPVFQESQLVRVRLRAVDGRKSERYFPSSTALRPALSLFVAAPSDSNIPRASVVSTDPHELAEMERLRRRALRPNAGPFGGREQFQLQQLLATGLNVAGAWFEWTVDQPVDHATYRKLRTVFLAKNAERSRLIEETLDADDLAAAAAALPPRIKSFRASLAEQVQAALPPENMAAFEAWRQQQMADQPEDPAAFVNQMINIEGAWLGVNARLEFTADQLPQMRPALQAAVAARGAAVGKLMRRETDSFEKFQESVGTLEKDLDNELGPRMTFRQRRALANWRGSQGSPIRPRLTDARPRPPRGHSAFVVIAPGSGEVQVFDFLHVTERSAGYKVRFHEDHPWNDMTSAAVIFEYNDRFVLAEPLAFELYRRAGNAACKTDFVRLSANGHLLGYHLVIEQVNGGFLRRNHLDSAGDLYKILWYRSGIEGQHEKQNHPDHSYAALTQLIALLESTQGDEQWQVIQKHFNVEQVINYFAVNLVLSHWDGFFNNYFTFHDLAASGKWEMYPWDQDKTWGFHDATPEQIFFDMPTTFGMAGDRPPDGVEANFGSWWRPGGYFSKPLLANREFRVRYLKRVRQILEEIYTEKGFYPAIDALAERLRPDIAIRAEVVGEDPDQALARLDRNIASLKEHLVKRRQFLLAQKEIADLPQ